MKNIPTYVSHFINYAHNIYNTPHVHTDMRRIDEKETKATFFIPKKNLKPKKKHQKVTRLIYLIEVCHIVTYSSLNIHISQKQTVEAILFSNKIQASKNALV